ncbi:MAG: hypothetical protein SWH61_17140 [Thermodesulfobacteriota bacterium]|nr:hypothetical protein [Thermodesulfobacteriota bacterium]
MKYPGYIGFNREHVLRIGLDSRPPDCETLLAASKAFGNTFLSNQLTPHIIPLGLKTLQQTIQNQPGVKYETRY